MPRHALSLALSLLWAAIVSPAVAADGTPTPEATAAAKQALGRLADGASRIVDFPYGDGGHSIAVFSKPRYVGYVGLCRRDMIEVVTPGSGTSRFRDPLRLGQEYLVLKGADSASSDPKARRAAFEPKCAELTENDPYFTATDEMAAEDAVRVLQELKGVSPQTLVKMSTLHCTRFEAETCKDKARFLQSFLETYALSEVEDRTCYERFDAKPYLACVDLGFAAPDDDIINWRLVATYNFAPPYKPFGRVKLRSLDFYGQETGEPH
jgi:hypothetical protein